MVIHKINNVDLSRQLKANNLDAYKQALEKEAQTRESAIASSNSKIKWNIVKKDDGTKKIDPLLETDHVKLSSIRQMDKSVSANVIAYKMGYKINLQEKIETLKDKYIKNFLQSKSHNFMVAKFAELKTAFLSQTLSNLGLAPPELMKMQKRALKGAQEENELLFEENEYNEEMIYVIGGSPKKIKKEVRIMDEIRQQLATQMNKLGKTNYYSQEHALTIKIKVCKRMREEFQKERDNLQYQRDYHFINKDAVSTGRTVFEKLNI
ncbi:MAG: hypothetical protein PHF25_01215 [Candidatus Margulisbacteria bacterium]|nr:hypothetical protein [Candidatus Margulisiibacteriota bacterium]